MAETIRFLTRRGIPVCGHVGLTPQAVKVMGFRAQGRAAAEAERTAADARAVAEAGAFALVGEGTYQARADGVTDSVPGPPIGRRASPAVDGQLRSPDDAP